MHIGAITRLLLALLEYGEYPFDLPWHDVQVWELQ